MAIYKNLHLPSGGGVISYNQQADQVRDRATILIGLGGTGIDCLKTIKGHIHKRLKPDDPNALIPTYRRIEFLGVDADGTSANFLDPGDFFDISYNGPLITLLQNKAAIDPKEEFDWLRNDQIKDSDLGGMGTGGVRQVGRLLMMGRAEAFSSTLQQKINNAKLNLVNPIVHVHIIAGISGGTGSGSFLDTCYIIRDILKGVENSNIFSYVFLPDVNLLEGMDNATVLNVLKNGYACLQEIDYCMSLDKNGGAFKQSYYPGKSIDWNQPPVDMCHLISSYNSEGETTPRAYAYAMNVVSEYIMDYVTDTPNENFTLSSSLADFKDQVAQKNMTKTQGYNLDYCGPGASCAIFPFMEMNTYLGSKLFHGFANLSQEHKPTDADVDQLAIDIFAPGVKNRSELYSYILSEVKKGDPSNDFEHYEGDYKELLPNNNAPFIKHYEDQKARKLKAVRMNAEELKDGIKKESYVARMLRSLYYIICGDDKQPAKGPTFAKDLLDESKSYSLFNIISNIRRENKENEMYDRLNHRDFFYPDYQKAEKDFLNQHKRNFLDNDKKRFQNYEIATRLEVRSVFDIVVYMEIENLLVTFENKVRSFLEHFYGGMERVLRNLTDTFKVNAGFLAIYDKVAEKNPFYMPMMTIQDLKESMDAEVHTLHLPKAFQFFMQKMYDRKDDWMEEDERKISRFVTDFLTKEVFSDFANRNITAFLKDKYNDPAPQVLVQKIYDDYIQKIATKASPLFPIDELAISKKDVAMLSHFSIPITSVEILQAANKYVSENTSEYNRIGVNTSNQTDRIYMLRNACAFPPGSYANLGKYETLYFLYLKGHFGRHLYEGERKGKEGRLSHMKFSDWRELPPLRPLFSLILEERVPEEMLRIILDSTELYNKGKELGVIVKVPEDTGIQCDDNIYTIDEKVMQDLEEKVVELEKALEKGLNDPVQATLADAKILIPKIEALLSTPLTPTGEILFRDGSTKSDYQKSIRADYFCSMPAKHTIVREGIRRLEKMDEYRKRLENCRSKLQEYET